MNNTYFVLGSGRCGSSTVSSSSISSSSSSSSSASSSSSSGVTLTAPDGVVAIGGDKEITISWNDVPGVTDYNIYYGKSSGVTVDNGTLISVTGATTYTHTGIDCATTYYYIITSTNEGIEGEASEEVYATARLDALSVEYLKMLRSLLPKGEAWTRM